MKTRQRPIGSTVAALFVAAWTGVAQAQTQTSAPSGPPPIPETATEAQGFLQEPLAIERAVLFADRQLGGGGAGSGWYADFGNMVPGAGWISIGPGYRRWFGNDDAVFDTSAAISWLGYRTAQARFEMPRLVRSRIALGSQIKWQDLGRVAYFGVGPQSVRDDRSAFRLRSTDVAGYTTFRPSRTIEVGASAGLLKPELLSQTGFFGASDPDTRTVFATDPAFAFSNQPSFLHGDASITWDTRDFAGHPTRGGLLRAAAANYSDRDTGLFSFRRYEAEGAGFVPFADSRVVLAVRGWIVGSTTDEGATVPMYLQPSLGGHNSLRGFDSYRFHDRSMLLLNTEVRVAMWTHVDVAAFVDAGSVAPRVGSLSLGKRDYGVGLRLHARRDTYVRLDVARSNEGWKVLFRLNEPLSLSRLTRRTAAAPFVP